MEFNYDEIKEIRLRIIDIKTMLESGECSLDELEALRIEIKELREKLDAYK